MSSFVCFSICENYCTLSLFHRNHPHGGKALPRNRTAKNTAPLAYAIRLRGRVPADAALTKMDGKMADFFGEKDS